MFTTKILNVSEIILIPMYLLNYKANGWFFVFKINNKKIRININKYILLVN